MKSGLFYLPILKWKAGEKAALKELSSELKKSVEPLVELVKKEKAKKTSDNKTIYIPIPDIDVFNEELNVIKTKFPDMTIFLDTRLLTDVDREDAVKHICEKVDLFGDNVYPVVYLEEINNSFSQETISQLNKKGYCLRVLRTELSDLESVNLTVDEKKAIDLVIDFGVTDESIDSVIPLLLKFTPESWKSITLASGAFPVNLSKFSVDRVDSEPRADWSTWKKVRGQLNGLSTYLNYGDYTIRHPIYENLRTPNTSCSFRYTGDDKWFVFRGLSRKSKNYRGHIQYRAHAVTIVENTQYQYSGENFSNGDMYIKSKAQLVDGDGKPLNKDCGNSTTWLQAGVSHHISKVVEQLSK